MRLTRLARLLRWVAGGLAAGVLAGFAGGLLASRRPAQGGPRYVPPSPDEEAPAADVASPSQRPRG